MYGQKEPLNKGYYNAVITADNKTVNTKVYVTEGNAESLLQHDSSFKLAILTQVNSVSWPSDQSKPDSLLKDVFQGLGKVKDFEHKTTVDPNVKPVSQQRRHIPKDIKDISLTHVVNDYTRIVTLWIDWTQTSDHPPKSKQQYDDFHQEANQKW